MKNNIVFKLIAILLCAATLMGAVGGIAGVIVLTSGDLYSQTVDEMVEKQVIADTADLSHWLAVNYASKELGGCSESFVNHQYGDSHWISTKYDPAHYGYAIFDEQGKELLSYNTDDLDVKMTYINTVEGQYSYLISLESNDDIEAREAQERIEAYGADTIIDESGNQLPAEGALVRQALFIDKNGAPICETWSDDYHGALTLYDEYKTGPTETYDLEGQAGYLFYNPEGKLVFQSFLELGQPMEEVDVYDVTFVYDQGRGTLALSGFDSEGGKPVGRLYFNEAGHMVFETPTARALSENAVPEETTEVLETVPEVSIPETVSQEAIDSTEVAETVPEEETAAATDPSVETVPSSASAVPENTETVESTEAAEAEETAQATVPETIPETLPETIPETIPAETAPEETVPENTRPTHINGKPLEDYQINTRDYHDNETGKSMHAEYVYITMPKLKVEVYMEKEALLYQGAYNMLEQVRQFRNYLLPGAAACLLVFALFFVYLCTAAGRKPKTDEVRAGGLNRLPLDLYLFCGGFAVALLVVYGWELGEMLLERDFWLGCGCIVIAVFLACLITVGFLFAFVAQIKTPDGFWWKNTLLGHCCRLLMRFTLWLEYFLADKGFPFLGKIIKTLWHWTLKALIWLYKATEKALLWLGNLLIRWGKWIGDKLHRFFSLLPVTWQWMIAGIAMVLFLFITVAGRFDFGIILSIIFACGLILYGSHCFGVLLDSTKKMGQGELDFKVDDKLMIGSFKEFAEDLNGLADVAVVAAQKQMKSERMKTELITNVSHDIKTPLTSIINYVDLLQKPHSEAEEAQYLEVLDRQSQRLKKLIDDLMDMSKANTGNMAVEITKVDAVESINQALGEFADKLDKAQLIPVFRHSEERLMMLADGKLVWRVLSNLLTNAVKYAMPGTRLYVDLMELDGRVVISLKNISREELNMDAEELMERFVRGDDSRNTDGSGLGLNIAQSLMELQKGQLQLLVDGDLFKVTLVFPGV